MLKKIVDNQYVLVTIHLTFLLWASFLPSSKAPSLVAASQTGLPWILDAPTLSRWSFPFVDLLSPTAYLLPPTLSLSLRWPYCPGGGSTFLPAMQCLLWWHSKRSVAIMYLVLCFPLGAISSSFWYTYLPFQRAVSRVWGIHLNHAKYLGILS